MSAGRLLLVGAGHAHLHLLDHAADLGAAGWRVTLLAPAAFRYSGVASATAAGDLPAGAGTLDVAALAAARGVAHHVGTLADLDLGASAGNGGGGTATADDGTRLGFDVVSLNLGSVAEPPGLAVADGVLRVKPLDRLAGLRERLAAPGLGGAARVTVVGAGASGLELAGHLSARPDVAAVRLLEAGPRIGPDLPPAAARRVARLLRRRGVEMRTGAAVAELGEHRARLADGTDLAHDLAVLATGLVAPPLLERTGLGDARGVPVTATLRHRDHDHVLAAGDCADFLPGRLPRTGVHGVRQGPVLLAGLLARAAGREPPAYTPPRRALAVLDLGGGTALAARGRLWWLGPSALTLKRWIDQRWLAGYAVPPRGGGRDSDR